MSTKYTIEQVPAKHRQSSDTIITNDLYLAAFLHSTGCRLSKVECNKRRRISFVLCGELVCQLRELYRLGPVRLDMRSFRESLITIRRLMDAEQRSISHARREQQSSPQQ